MAEILPLTGIRGICALWIVWFHFHWILTQRQIEVFLPSWQGWVLVDMFFILSGFILTATHPDLKPSETRGFILKRFARVYPLHLFALILLAAFVGMAYLIRPTTNLSSYPLSGFIASVFMVNEWMPKSGTWNFPSWSVQVEMLLYCTLPLVIPAVGSLRRPVGLALVVALILLIWSILDPDRSDPSPIRVYIVAFSEMIIGSITYRITKDVKIKELPFNMAFVGFLVLAATGNQLYTLPLIAFFVAGLAQRVGVISWFLSKDFVVFLGEISYSIYMMHVPLFLAINAFVPVEKWVTSTFSAAVYAVSFVGIVIAASALSYRYVEVPARRWITSLAKRSRPAKPPAVIGGEPAPDLN